MQVKFRCPCGARLSVASRHAGRTVRCPKCGRRVVAGATPAHESESAGQASASAPAPPQPSSAQSPRPTLSKTAASRPAAATANAAAGTVLPPPPSSAARASATPAAGSSLPDPTRPERSTGASPPAARPPIPPPRSGELEPSDRAAPAREVAASESGARGETAELSSEQLAAYEPNRRQASAARSLGTALTIVALVSLAPAVWDVFEHARGAGVARWAYAVFFLGLLQFAYGIYALQLPDWSSLWVVTLVTLVAATVYAAMLGVTLVTGPQGGLVEALDLSDRLAGGRAAGWCFIMLSVTGLISYLSGRISVRWSAAGA